jgi:hypothetical protein
MRRAPAGPDGERAKRSSKERRGQGGRSRPEGAGQRPLGDRPQAPWHPLPLSELLILVGAIGTVVGFQRGESGIPVLFAGLAAVLIGTVEVTLREHLSGYRSHTLILTLLPAIALYTGVVLIARPPTAANLALLGLDVALAVFLFKWLRSRFLDARRERKFAGKR